MNSDANAPYAPEDEHAGIALRFLAYAIDSAVLFGVSLLFASFGLIVILLGSDGGRSNISDREEMALLLSLMVTFPLWYAFNVLLTARRGHTIGQYVMGLRITDESGAMPTPGRASLYWLALHPLLFHPILAVPWLLFAVLGVTLAESQVVFVGALGVTFLCFASPIANLIFIAIDPQRRGIHDRLTRIKVVHL